MKPTWDILICSIAERTELLKDLLAELKRQIGATPSKRPNYRGVGVIVFRDNKETTYGSKCQALLEASKAEYTCFLDDDDWIAQDYVASIVEALKQRPDYVGFKVKYTIDGNPAIPVIHSTTNGIGWQDTPNALYRDIAHFNPIRREIALRGLWEGGDGADRRWADQVRATGGVQSEVFIDRELHHYRFQWHETFTVSSQRPPLPEMPYLPKYRWVKWIDSTQNDMSVLG